MIADIGKMKISAWLTLKLIKKVVVRIPQNERADLMTIGESDISALRECIMGTPNFSDAEKDMLIDAITVAIFRFEQREKQRK